MRLPFLLMTALAFPSSYPEEAKPHFNKKLQRLVQLTEDDTVITDSSFTDLFNLQFSYDNAQDLVAGFSYQLLNDLFLYNAQDCTFWVFDSFSDSLNGFLLMVEDNKPMQAILSFAYSFHKAPIAYYSCNVLLDDYTSIVVFYDTITTTADLWGEYSVTVFYNLVFNWVDIFYELVSLYRSWEEREWTMIGKFIAQIISDVFFKSPISPSWNYQNSDVMNDEWGEPLGLASGLLNELNEILEAAGLDPIWTDLVPDNTQEPDEEEDEVQEIEEEDIIIIDDDEDDEPVPED